MSFEIKMLALSAMIGLLQIVLGASASTKQRGLSWNLSSRDAVVAPLTGVAGRLDRVLKNFLETYPLFIAAVIAARFAEVSNVVTHCGAALYILGRIIYVPVYALGITGLRTVIWSLSALGIVLVLSQLLT